MNEPKSKLFLVSQGTAVNDLEFCKKILKYYGYDVKEFPAGPDEMWANIYSKEV